MLIEKNHNISLLIFYEDGSDSDVRPYRARKSGTELLLSWDVRKPPAARGVHNDR